MITVTAPGVKIACTRAEKGPDYIKLYDSSGAVAAFSGIADFSQYAIEGGSWETATPQIADLKKRLTETDYSLMKALEAILSCTSALDLIAKLAALRTTYAATLSDRTAWRKKINELGG